MKFVILFLLSINNTFASPIPKIIGGEKVHHQSNAPWMVKFGLFCSGTVLNSQWILTAGHCISPWKWRVRGGGLNQYFLPESYLIEKQFRHPSFSKVGGDGYSHDFGLIKLKTPIHFQTSRLRPITLADSELTTQATLEGAKVDVFGWGFLREFNPLMPAKLHVVSVPLVTNEIANLPQSYGGIIDETMIAAGYQEGGSDSCSADSGGPLVIENPTSGKIVQLGIVSWGTGCARKNKYGIYSNISVVRDWISQTIKSN